MNTLDWFINETDNLADDIKNGKKKLYLVETLYDPEEKQDVNIYTYLKSGENFQGVIKKASLNI